MRQISCPICDGEEAIAVYAATLPTSFDESAPPSPYAAHYQINQCIECGLLYSSPVMDGAGVSALYEKSSETNVVPGEEKNVRHTMDLYYRLAAPHLERKQRILDVGCDVGFLLEAARKDGFVELFGIEPTPPALATARKIPGCTVVSTFYEDTEYTDNSFDLITLIHVLDHLFNPNIVLKRAYGQLRPGGLIVAVVHNVDSLLGRLLGERFPVFNLYHHFFFNKSTLAELFRRHGYEIVDVVSTRNCYSVDFFVRRLPVVPECLKKIISKMLGFIGLAETAVTVPVGNIGIIARRPHD